MRPRSEDSEEFLMFRSMLDQPMAENAVTERLAR
jgi:hypothetical protein